MFRIKKASDGIKYIATIELAHNTVISTSDAFYHKKSAWMWILKKADTGSCSLEYYVKDLSGKKEINYRLRGGSRYRVFCKDDDITDKISYLTRVENNELIEYNPDLMYRKNDKNNER